MCKCNNIDIPYPNNNIDSICVNVIEHDSKIDNVYKIEIENEYHGRQLINDYKTSVVGDMW